jgi:hypothetical protein
MSEKRDNSGILYKNPDKTPDNKFPEYKGEATIDGKDYWVSAWVKEGAKGKFFSIAYKAKQASKQPAKQPAFEDNLADDPIIPF